MNRLLLNVEIAFRRLLIWFLCMQQGTQGSSSVVRESEFKSEYPGFDPLVKQGEVQVFFYPSESILVQTCLCLTPIRVYARHAPKCVRTLNIPYPSVVTQQASEPVVWNHENTAYRKRTKCWVVPYYGCSLSLRGKHTNISRDIAMGKESY